MNHGFVDVFQMDILMVDNDYWWCFFFQINILRADNDICRCFSNEHIEG